MKAMKVYKARGVGVQPCRVLRVVDIGQGLLHYRSHAPRVGICKKGGQQLTETTFSKQFLTVQKNNKVLRGVDKACYIIGTMLHERAIGWVEKSKNEICL